MFWTIFKRGKYFLINVYSSYLIEICALGIVCLNTGSKTDLHEIHQIKRTVVVMWNIKCFTRNVFQQIFKMMRKLLSLIIRDPIRNSLLFWFQYAYNASLIFYVSDRKDVSCQTYIISRFAFCFVSTPAFESFWSYIVPSAYHARFCNNLYIGKK